MYWAARKLLEILASRAPRGGRIDDIHWAETALLDLIEHLLDDGVRGLDDARLPGPARVRSSSARTGSRRAGLERSCVLHPLSEAEKSTA